LWKEEFELRGPNALRKSAEEDEPLDPGLWGQKEIELLDRDGNVVDTIQPTWDDLKRCVKKYGTRNSLLTCLQPTASTAQILRNAEGPEAHQANVYSRKVMSGGYPIVNRYLIWDLEEIGLWNTAMLDYISACGGSVQSIHRYIDNNSQLFPDFNGDVKRLSYVQEKYKTMWELKQKNFLILAAERGRYIDQSQSTNIYLADPSPKELEAVYTCGDLLGLKTGMYYLRQQPSMEPIKFTVDANLSKYVKGQEKDQKELREPKEETKEPKEQKEEKLSCTIKRENGIECLSCQ
jgi:ribonucleotide reductase alpha subunit